MPVQRLEFDQLSTDLAQRLGPRVVRLGYLGEFFKCAAHQPEALAAFIDFTETGKRSLESRMTEVIALTVATWMGNSYERNQHERLCIRLGFAREWIRDVAALDPDAASQMADDELRLQRLVIAILESRGHGVGGVFEEIVEAIGQKAAIAILMVIGRYVTHALIVNVLALPPPVPSIFEDDFTQ